MASQPVVLTWPQVISATLTLIIAGTCAQWALLAHHEGRPHQNAVHVREFERMRDDLQEIKKDVKAIRENGK